MTREQLRDILASLEECEYFSDRTQNWLNICRIAKLGQITTIRYIGKVSYPSSPYQRSHNDSRTGGSSLFFRHFLFILKSVHLSIFTDGYSYLLYDSTIRWFSTKHKHRLQNIADNYKRFFIAFFKSYALLNQQAGGDSFDFTPPIEDKSPFYKCRTSTVLRSKILLQLPLFRIQDSIRTYCQEFANWVETPGSTCKDQTMKVNTKYLDALCYRCSVPCMKLFLRESA